MAKTDKGKKIVPGKPHICKGSGGKKERVKRHRRSPPN